MKRKKHVGFMVSTLDKCMNRFMESAGRKFGMDEMTRMHGWILGYLYHNQDKEIYQKNLETEFSIGRSTVTNIVKMMESRGYIRREEVPSDARLKKLVLTEEGIQMHLNTIALFDEMEERVTKDVSPEELESFFAVAEKMKQNAEKMMGEMIC